MEKQTIIINKDNYEELGEVNAFKIITFPDILGGIKPILVFKENYNFMIDYFKLFEHNNKVNQLVLNTNIKFNFKVDVSTIIIITDDENWIHYVKDFDFDNVINEDCIVEFMNKEYYIHDFKKVLNKFLYLKGLI